MFSKNQNEMEKNGNIENFTKLRFSSTLKSILEKKMKTSPQSAIFSIKG